MKCFYHHEIDAVGICKNCNKGICPDCLTEVHNGIACTKTCIEEVSAIDTLIQNNKDVSKRKTNVKGYLVSAIFSSGAGLIFIVTSIQNPVMSNFMFPLGVLFLFSGLAYFFITRKKANGNK